MNDFQQFDTVLAVKSEGSEYKGFLYNAFKSKLTVFNSNHYKTIYLVLPNGKPKKFYGKRKILTLYSTRMVLIEKIIKHKNLFKYSHL
jgi:hypothetical protein